MKKKNITVRIRNLMADGLWRTRGDIRTALALPPDTEVGPRIRDLRKASYGEFTVMQTRLGDQYYYWFTAADCAKAKQLKEAA